MFGMIIASKPICPVTILSVSETVPLSPKPFEPDRPASKLSRPVKSHGDVRAAIKRGYLGDRIDAGRTVAPITILMPEVKPAPSISGLTKDEARSKRLQTPIELLNHAHLGSIWGDGPTNDAGRGDTPNEYASDNPQNCNRHDSQFHSSRAHVIYAAVRSALAAWNASSRPRSPNNSSAHPFWIQELKHALKFGVVGVESSCLESDLGLRVLVGKQEHEPADI